jgi:hypothetical protein
VRLRQRTTDRALRRRQLHLEPLEERNVPAITYHGGALLPHVAVEADYVGNFWSSAAGLQEASDLNNFLAYLVNSPYMDMLSEYGVGRGSLVDNGIVHPGLAAGQTVDDRALQHMLDADLASGNLQAPTANSLYFVFTPPNVIVTQGTANSLNDFFGYHDAFTDSAGQRVFYAVIANPVGNGDFYNLNDFQTLTKVVSHELAEGVTDPDSGGWFDSMTGNEIGDLANGPDDIGTLNGYVVQAEWSVQQGTAILPANVSSVGTVPPAQEFPNAPVLFGVANAFTHSDEYFGDLIANDYQLFLGRAASPAEIAGWVNGMQLGMTDEQVMAAFAGSPEFYQHAGGTNQGFIDAVYQDILGRTPDAAGEAAWLAALAAGAPRSAIAYGFAVSAERESLVVSADYQRYLGRTLSQQEVAGWVSAFQRGVTNEQVVSGFLASSEYFQRQGGTIEGWLTGIYHDVLNRVPDKVGFTAWDTYLEATFV